MPTTVLRAPPAGFSYLATALGYVLFLSVRQVLKNDLETAKVYVNRKSTCFESYHIVSSYWNLGYDTNLFLLSFT